MASKPVKLDALNRFVVYVRTQREGADVPTVEQEILAEQLADLNRVPGVEQITHETAMTAVEDV